MNDFNTLSISDLTQICGGGEYTNDYSDLSGLVPGHLGHRPTNPDDALNHFLYGGYMSSGEREALIKNWEESNGRKAPPPKQRTPQRR
jgi:hypothetical protein